MMNKKEQPRALRWLLFAVIGAALLLVFASLFTWIPCARPGNTTTVRLNAYRAGAAAAASQAERAAAMLSPPPCTTPPDNSSSAVTRGSGNANSSRTDSSSNSTSHASGTGASQPSRVFSEWHNHIIFENNNGTLEPCPSPHNNSGNSSHGASNGWISGTWLHPSSQTSDGGFMLPLSAQVQQLIWQHQHPADCSTAKFLLYQDPGLDKLDHGVGSVLHIQTMALMMAINSGRVFVTVPGAYLAADPYCSSTNRSTLDSCYFEPLTHCNVTEQQRESAWKFAAASEQDQDKFVLGTSQESSQFASMDGYMPFHQKHSRTAPKPFQALLKNTTIPERTWYYWWRAQALSYIMRPNARTLQQLAVRQRDMLRGLPLAPGCISVFIRHGDKGSESQLFADESYEEAIVRLRSIEPSLTRQLFLSTEDPATVVYFTNASRNWGTSYVDMPRKPDPKKKNTEYMKEFGFANSMLDGLLNLHLALTCDGFVSAFSSNWARMIEELRSTIRCKAQAVYMDVTNRRPNDFYERH